MTLAGTGAICIWNDITDAGRTDFYSWHLREHIPERVGIPGFCCGRRYIACSPYTVPEFFTLYETATTEILTGPEYLARLNAPTAWTRQVTREFRNTLRALTEVVFSRGEGPGGVLATLRLAFADSVERLAFLQGTRELLDHIATQPEITGIHLCLTDTLNSAARTAETRDRADILAAPDGVIFVEGCGIASVEAASSLVQRATEKLLKQPAVLGLYRLEHLHSSKRPV